MEYTKELIRFGKRMDAAEDKKMLIEYAAGFKHILDLGAGTGKIAREIAAEYGCHVDAVDVQFKTMDLPKDDNVTYYPYDILQWLEAHKNTIEVDRGKYDCIILSAVLHEMPDDYIISMRNLLVHYYMDTDCRIIIREPFYDLEIGPLDLMKADRFVNLVTPHIPLNKYLEYRNTIKLDGTDLRGEDANFSSYVYLNLCFALAYGPDSWEREVHEQRFARALDWCKTTFNKLPKPYTGFQAIPVRDASYRDHFIKAGLPGEAFDLIQYTGMLVIIDYSSTEGEANVRN